MSTYDAYNLSLRDSTEFTVPAGGGSGGDGDFSIAHITFDFSALSGPSGENSNEFSNEFDSEINPTTTDEVPIKLIGNFIIGNSVIQPFVDVFAGSISQTINVIMYKGLGVIYSSADIDGFFTVEGNDLTVVSNNLIGIYDDNNGLYSYEWHITGDATLIANSF